VLCRACQSNIDDTARFCPECGIAIVTHPPQFGRGFTFLIEGVAHVTIVEPLGEGGMGVVYRGWLDYLPTGRLAGAPGHPVAVKVLRPELRGRERVRRMFHREAIALGRLAHPNIVHFIALHDRDGQIAIVMELVNGEPLSHLLRRASAGQTHAGMPCLPMDQAWHILSQLLGALAAVHILGILHRDVKSANVLIRPDGVAKLTDFGIARLPESGGKNTGGMIAGTGAYMAPEHVRGEEIDPRADLYAAAILFFEMVTGVTPFDSPERDEATVRIAQIEEAPPALSQLVSGIPHALDVVMAHALAKDRRHRYATALDLGEAIRAAIGIGTHPIWSAQREFAAIARTLSEQLPAVQSDVAEHAQRLRTAMMTPLWPPHGN
jgi:serine/threonine-protein kinase